MKTNTLLVITIFLITATNLAAQSTFYSDEFLTRNKQIEEFIDRFSYTDESKQRGYKLLSRRSNSQNQDISDIYQLIYSRENASRVSVLLSLFDYENINAIGKDKIKEFVKQVTDSATAQTLNFYDLDWYAVVEADFRFKNKTQNGILVIKNDIKPDVKGYPASFWGLVSASANFLKPDFNENQRQGVNAGAHGVNFVPLMSAFEDKQNIFNVVSNDFVSNDLSILLYATNNGDVSLEGINSVSYHFMQIDGWVFKVEYFNRSTSNSGWLISDLFKASQEDKKAYREQVLKIF